MTRSVAFRSACALGLGLSMALLATSALAEGAIPYRTESVLTGERLVRMGLGLGVSAALVWGVLYGLRRFVPSMTEATGSSGRIEVVETHALSPSQALLLVRVEGRSLLLSRSRDGFSTLADLGDAASSDDVETAVEDARPAPPRATLTSLFPRTGTDRG